MIVATMITTPPFGGVDMRFGENSSEPGGWCTPRVGDGSEPGALISGGHDHGPSGGSRCRKPRLGWRAGPWVGAGGLRSLRPGVGPGRGPASSLWGEALRGQFSTLPRANPNKGGLEQLWIKAFRESSGMRSFRSYWSADS